MNLLCTVKIEPREMTWQLGCIVTCSLFTLNFKRLLYCSSLILGKLFPGWAAEKVLSSSSKTWLNLWSEWFSVSQPSNGQITWHIFHPKTNFRWYLLNLLCEICQNRPEGAPLVAWMHFFEPLCLELPLVGSFLNINDVIGRISVGCLLVLWVSHVCCEMFMPAMFMH